MNDDELVTAQSLKTSFKELRNAPTTKLKFLEEISAGAFLHKMISSIYDNPDMENIAVNLESNGVVVSLSMEILDSWDVSSEGEVTH